MTSNDIPSYIYKLPINEDVVATAVKRLLEEIGMVNADEEKALKLFYGILAHIMYHLYSYTGQYFRLKFVDIVGDDNNLICVKRNPEYTKDTMNAKIFYDHFCGTEAFKRELQEGMDLFIGAITGMKTKMDREIHNLDYVIQRRRVLAEAYSECSRTMRKSKKYKKFIEKRRKADLVVFRKQEAKKLKKYKISPIELVQRKKREEQYADLEHELRELWEQDNTQMPFEINA